MTEKILLFKAESKGNLRDSKQSYYGYYYPKVVENDKVVLCDKAVFTLVTPSIKGDGEEVVRSYRMIDPAQVRLLVFDVLKMYAFFLLQKGELNSFNINYRHQDMSRETLKIFKEVAQGEI